jgi:hypothetical protein
MTRTILQHAATSIVTAVVLFGGSQAYQQASAPKPVAYVAIEQAKAKPPAKPKPKAPKAPKAKHASVVKPRILPMWPPCALVYWGKDHLSKQELKQHMASASAEQIAKGRWCLQHRRG